MSNYDIDANHPDAPELYALAPRPSDELFQKRWNAAETAGFDACQHCGRKVAAGRGYDVMMCVDGTLIPVEAWDDPAVVDSPANQGGWTLGTECGKLVPNEYRMRRSA